MRFRRLVTVVVTVSGVKLNLTDACVCKDRTDAFTDAFNRNLSPHLAGLCRKNGLAGTMSIPERSASRMPVRVSLRCLALYGSSV